MSGLTSLGMAKTATRPRTSAPNAAGPPPAGWAVAASAWPGAAWSRQARRSWLRCRPVVPSSKALPMPRVNAGPGHANADWGGRAGPGARRRAGARRGRAAGGRAGGRQVDPVVGGRRPLGQGWADHALRLRRGVRGPGSAARRTDQRAGRAACYLAAETDLGTGARPHRGGRSRR